MLTLKLLREQPEFVIERLAVKHFDARDIVYDIIDLDKKRRLAQQEARRLAPVPGSDLRGRPTKKARRLIHGFNDNF